MTDARAWEHHYPAHLQGYRLGGDALADNLSKLAKRGAQRFGDAAAFTQVLPNGLSTDLSFAAIERFSDAFAAYLMHEQNLQSGEVVALQLPNSLHYPIAVLGAWKAGLIVTNVNPLYTEQELDAQLTNSGARLLVACDLFAKRAQGVVEQSGIALVLTSLGDFFPVQVGLAIQAQLVEQAGHDLVPQVAFQRFSRALEIGQTNPLQAREHAVALYQYTGGTTGRSKGAVLSHSNLQAVLYMADDYISGFGAAIEPGDTIVTLPPLYRIFAFTFNFLLFLRSGGRNLLVANPRPLVNAQPAFENFPVRWMTGVDTLYAGLLAEPWFQAKPPALKLAVSGGTAMRPVTGERWQKLVGRDSRRLRPDRKQLFRRLQPAGAVGSPGHRWPATAGH